MGSAMAPREGGAALRWSGIHPCPVVLLLLRPLVLLHVLALWSPREPRLPRLLSVSSIVGASPIFCALHI